MGGGCSTTRRRTPATCHRTWRDVRNTLSARTMLTAMFRWASLVTGTGPVREDTRGSSGARPCWCSTRTERGASRPQQKTVISPPPGRRRETSRETRHSRGHPTREGEEDDLREDLRRQRDNLNHSRPTATTTNNHHYLSTCPPAPSLSTVIRYSYSFLLKSNKCSKERHC